MNRALLGCCLAVVWLAKPGCAHASEQPPSDAPPVKPESAPIADPLEDYRRRHAEAQHLYQEGKLAEAIGYWEALYADLPLNLGYRIAFNLGVSYQAIGNATSAVEHYEAYLQELDKRRASGRTKDAVTEKKLDEQAAYARAQIEKMKAMYARLHIKRGHAGLESRINKLKSRLSGYVAWVQPGEYTITFGAGTRPDEVTTVQVQAGELREIEPPAPPPPNVIERRFETRFVTKRPYSPALIYVAGGLAAVASATMVVGYARTASIRNEYGTTNDISRAKQLESQYDGMRTLGNVSIPALSVLGTVTGGLIVGYFTLSKEQRISTPKPMEREKPSLHGHISPSHNGVVMGAEVRF